MLLSVLEFLWWWFQPEGTGAGGAAGGGGAATAGGDGGSGGIGGCGGSSMLMYMLPMLAIMYFLMIRPQQKQQKAVDDLQKSLKRGDKVRTTSGIRGEIAEINEKDVNLVIADRVKINVLRTHIAGIENALPANVTGADKDKKETEKSTS